MKSRALLLIVVLLASRSLGFAQDARNTGALRGLGGVAVTVYDITQEAERDGLSQATLQTDVELRLRKAGIRVLTGEQWLNEPGQPTLKVIVGLYKVPSDRVDGYAKSLRGELWQHVLLSRNPSTILRAATWTSVELVGISNSDTLNKSIRDDVADLVDDFINNFLAENQK